jgi:hypothetical protein
MNNVVDTLVEIRLIEDDDFLKIKETLTRIGIASPKTKKLYQSCHILHKRGKYYIVHFKELFALDGKPSNFSEEDKSRRNTIIDLLSTWDLLEIVDPSSIEQKTATSAQTKVISHKDKSEWELIAKYDIGKKM